MSKKVIIHKDNKTIPVKLNMEFAKTVNSYTLEEISEFVYIDNSLVDIINTDEFDYVLEDSYSVENCLPDTWCKKVDKLNEKLPVNDRWSYVSILEPFMNTFIVILICNMVKEIPVFHSLCYSIILIFVFYIILAIRWFRVNRIVEKGEKL